MDFIKRYFAYGHRMSRKPYIIVFVLYTVAAFALGGLVMDPAAIQARETAATELMAQQRAGTITDEDYSRQLMAIQEDARGQTPAWQKMAGMLLLLGYLPALAMRLKDVNLSPRLALIVLVPTIPGLAPIPSSMALVFAAVSMAIFAAEIFLMVKRGTTGPNKYGADPLAAG